MKLKTLIIFALLISSFMFAKATNIDSLDTRMDINKEIHTNIGYPSFASELGIEGTVYLRLELMENGKINIIQKNSKNEELLQYVVANISHMKFDPKLYKTNDPINMRFDFKLL